MKKYFTISFAFILSLQLNAQTPLTADAGKDTTYCYNNDTPPHDILLGAKTTAIGGVPPYTYNWTMYSMNTGTELTFLSDYKLNNLANPSISLSISNDIYKFKVVVKDSKDSIAFDSLIIGYSYFYGLLCCGTIDGIGKDSVLLLNNQVGGGLKPISYKWTPSIGLSNDTIAHPKAKPVFPNITYYVEETDSLGCKFKDSWGIIVTDIKNGNLNTGFVSYKNPVSNSGSMDFTTELLGSKLQIVSVSGIVQYQTKVENESIPLGSLISTTGIYYYTLTTPIGTILSGSFIRE